MASSEHHSPVDFIRAKILTDHETGRFSQRVHTRFPPEPNGQVYYVIVLGHLDGISAEAFGKLIMYAAGLEAKAIICVGQEITAEIRQSLNWLNMVLRDDVNFYATELELWRIDDSVPAPNFNVVCQPNMWARQLKMGQEDGEAAGGSKSKDFSESKSKKEDPSKGSKEKVGAAQGKSGPSSKDGVSVRQNFVYTKTFS